MHSGVSQKADWNTADVTGHTSGGCTVNHNCKQVDPQTEAEICLIIIEHVLPIG